MELLIIIGLVTLAGAVFICWGDVPMSGNCPIQKELESRGLEHEYEGEK